MSTTTNIALNEPAYNSTSPTWDQPLNYNSTILDSVLGNTTSVSLTSTNVTLTSPNSTGTGQTQVMRLVLTGALSANVSVIIPAGISGRWIVYNTTSGAYTVTIASGGGGNSVTVAQGYNTSLYSDGTNIRYTNDGLFQGGTFANITVTGTSTLNTANITTANITNQTVSGSSQIASLGVGTTASGTTGEIRATNNVTAYYSDERLKTRLGGIDDALNKVKSLSGFYYQANEAAQALGYKVVKEVGVSAQEVEVVMPEVVAPAPIDENYLTVRYERLVPLLIEAIKELSAKVERLEQNNG
jgi:Chaperone of endosialidase